MGKSFALAILACIMMLMHARVNAQAHSGIGLGAGVNVPFASGYSTGADVSLQGNIRLGNRFALVPAIGAKQIKGDGAIIHEGYQGYSTYTRGDLGGISLALSGKYYFTQQWFASAGVLGIINADRSSSGGLLAIGYQIPFDNQNNVEFDLSGSVLKWSRTSGSTTVAVAGLRIAYNFNFRK